MKSRNKILRYLRSLISLILSFMTWFLFLFFVIFTHAHHFHCDFRWGKGNSKNWLSRELFKVQTPKISCLCLQGWRHWSAQNVLLVWGPVATGNDQICFVLMEKEASNYAFPTHAVCAPCTFTCNASCSSLLCEIA